MKLEVSLFKFDYQSDYLPYYKKYFITIRNEKTLLDMFNTMYLSHPFSYENSLDFGVVVNGCYINVSVLLHDLIENFGTLLVIKPLSIKRAYNDLLINSQDFYDKLESFPIQIEEEDRLFYEKQKNLYYASNTLNFNPSYIGDPFLLLAYRLLSHYENNKAMRQKILKRLSCPKSGIMYHTSLIGRVYNYDIQLETNINELKSEFPFHTPFQQSVYHFLIIEKENMDVKRSFKDWRVFYYCGSGMPCNDTLNLLEHSKADRLESSSMYHDIALDVLSVNANFVFAVAANVLLDAYDQGADFVLVDDENLLYFFDVYRKQLESVSQRDIPIPILHRYELYLLLEGRENDAQKTLTLRKTTRDLF